MQRKLQAPDSFTVSGAFFVHAFPSKKAAGKGCFWHRLRDPGTGFPQLCIFAG